MFGIWATTSEVDLMPASVIACEPRAVIWILEAFLAALRRHHDVGLCLFPGIGALRLCRRRHARTQRHR
jgi:hypothetical protein